MKITNRTIVAEIGTPELSEAQQLVGKILAKRIERDLMKQMLGGWPEGYEPGKGFPGTYYLNGPPRCCYGTVLHAPNCKFWCTAT